MSASCFVAIDRCANPILRSASEALNHVFQENPYPELRLFMTFCDIRLLLTNKFGLVA
jgi:hypothetical protein